MTDGRKREKPGIPLRAVPILCPSRSGTPRTREKPGIPLRTVPAGALSNFQSLLDEAKRRKPDITLGEFYREYIEKASPEERGYQGWENKETWAMALWLDNDRALYDESRRIAREAVRGKDALLVDAEDELKGWAEELAETACEEPDARMCKMFQDIGSLWRINWREVAESRFEEDELKRLHAQEDERRRLRMERFRAERRME